MLPECAKVTLGRRWCEYLGREPHRRFLCSFTRVTLTELCALSYTQDISELNLRRRHLQNLTAEDASPKSHAPLLAKLPFQSVRSRPLPLEICEQALAFFPHRALRLLGELHAGF